ncbi:hypothetical protein Bca4012_072394 [Brassica carinata]
MARPDSPSDDESPRTGGAPTAAAFTDTILERMAQQEAVQKATNEQLATIAAPFAGNSGDPASTVRKQRFDTCRTAGAANTTNTNAAQVQTPGGVDLVTVRELAELKQSFLDMKDRMLEGPTAAPLIERVLAETVKTHPFFPASHRRSVPISRENPPSDIRRKGRPNRPHHGFQHRDGSN